MMCDFSTPCLVNVFALSFTEMFCMGSNFAYDDVVLRVFIIFTMRAIRSLLGWLSYTLGFLM
jgi:hypothetical protein